MSNPTPDVTQKPLLLTLTLAHEYNQSPRSIHVNSAYIVSITTPPPYGYREVGYGRNPPYPSNARAKLLLGLPHDTVTEYVTETPEQIQALLEDHND